MKAITKITAALLLAAAMFSGCTKKGDTGAAGKDGKDGNANVTSETLTIGSGGWSWHANPNFRYASWTPYILTSNVITSGAIMVYQTDGTNYVALPITQNVGSSGIQEHDYFTYDVNGYFNVFIENSDGSDPNPSSSFTYKLVCIPQHMIKPNVNMKNYSEVKAAYQLKD